MAEALRQLPRSETNESEEARWYSLIDAMDEEEKDALVALWQEWRKAPTDEVCQALRESSPKALAAYFQGPFRGAHYTGAGSLADALALLADDPLVPWGAILHVCDRGWARDSDLLDYRRQFVEGLGERALAAAAAKVQEHKYRVCFLGVLADLRTPETLPHLAAALGNSSKVAREIAHKAMVQAGADALPYLLPMLQGRKKRERLVAAELLVHIGDSQALEALEAARTKEKNRDVQDALDKAIAACTSTADFDVSAASEDALMQWLEAEKLPTTPTFLRSLHAPSVSFASGTSLTHDAHEGLLALLSTETRHQRNPITHALRGQLEPGSLSALGKHIVECWYEAGQPEAQGWALHQLAVSADTKELYRLGDALELLFAESLDNAKAYIGVLARHSSQLGVSWLWYYHNKGVAYSQRRDAIQEGLQTAARVRGIEGDDWEEQLRQDHIWEGLAQEREDIAYFTSWERGFRLADRHFKGFHFSLSFHPTALPTPGTLDVHPQMRIEPTKEDASALEKHRAESLRWARIVQEKQQLLLDRFTAKVKGRITQLTKEGRWWSFPGWRAIFVERLLCRWAASQALFVTSEGQVLHMSPDTSLRDLSGALVSAVDLAESRLSLFDHRKLTKEQARAWESTMAERWSQCVAEWEALCLDDPLSVEEDEFTDLRALLSQPASEDTWEALTTFFSVWPEHKKRDVAVSYAATHLSSIPAWEEQPRPAPLDWALRLLPPDHEARAQQKLDPAQDPGYLSMLQLCHIIHLPSCSLREEDVQHIWEQGQRYAPQTKKLSLYRGRLYASAVKELATYEGFGDFEAVSLQHIQCYPRGWELLFGAPWLQRASALTLTHLNLPHSALHKLAESRQAPLRALDLSRTTLTPESFQLIAVHPAFASLEALQFRNTRELQFGIQYLAASKQLKQLRSLDISFCFVGPAGIQALAEAKHLESLTELSVNGNACYGESEASILARSTTLPRALVEQFQHEQE